MSWIDASTLPPDGVEVLCELKPRRKNAKRRVFRVGSYHADDVPELSGWWCSAADCDIDVICWQPIIPQTKEPA